MRMAFVVLGAALFCFASSSGNAADLPLPHHQHYMPVKALPQKTASCMRWVEQNYSWYNYCDPVPYYGRHENHWFPGPF